MTYLTSTPFLPTSASGRLLSLLVFGIPPPPSLTKGAVLASSVVLMHEYLTSFSSDTAMLEVRLISQGSASAFGTSGS
jgi:hypothetical protein